MTEPISILLPTYNRLYTLHDCIHSLLHQTYPNIRIIVYDDGSTGGTPDYFKNMKSKYVKYIRSDKNNDFPYAANRLLEACDTRLAAWQGSDDLSNIHRIQMQYNAMKETGCEMIFTGYRKIKNVRDCNIFENPVDAKNNKKANGSCLFIVDKSVTFPENYNYGSDGVWNGKMFAKYNWHIIHKELYYLVYSYKDRIGNRRKNLAQRKEML